MRKPKSPTLASTLAAINRSVRQFVGNDESKAKVLADALVHRTAVCGDPSDDEPIAWIMRLVHQALYQSETVPEQKRRLRAEQNEVIAKQDADIAQVRLDVSEIHLRLKRLSASRTGKAGPKKKQRTIDVKQDRKVIAQQLGIKANSVTKAISRNRKSPK